MVNNETYQDLLLTFAFLFIPRLNSVVFTNVPIYREMRITELITLNKKKNYTKVGDWGSRYTKSAQKAVRTTSEI